MRHHIGNTHSRLISRKRECHLGVHYRKTGLENTVGAQTQFYRHSVLAYMRND